MIYLAGAFFTILPDRQHHGGIHRGARDVAPLRSPFSWGLCKEATYAGLKFKFMGAQPPAVCGRDAVLPSGWTEEVPSVDQAELENPRVTLCELVC